MKQATYNNIDDKFELLKYEENIVEKLSKKFAEDILISFSNFNKMIFKNFQLKKLNFDNYNFYLFYGKNEGFKMKLFKNISLKILKVKL